MIVVRVIFHLKFGMAKKASEALRNGRTIIEKNTDVPMRILSDITGKSYTFVTEMTFKSLADFETSLAKNFSNPDWQKWYDSFIPLVDSSYREIMNVVE